MRSKGKINVPDHLLPGVAGRLVRIHVLAPAVGEAVVVADDVLDGVSLEPVVHVHLRLELASVIRAQLGEVRRIHKCEKVGVIAGGPVHGAFGERPAVTRELLLAACRGEFLQRSAVRAEGGRSIVELEPKLDLVQIAIRAVRVKLVGQVAVGLLHVLEHLRAPDAVDKQVNVPSIAVRQPDLVRDPIGRLLALIRIVAAAVAGPLERCIGLAQQRIVVRKRKQIITDVANGRIESRRVVRAAGILAADIVNDAVVAIHECAVERLVAQVLAVRPAVQRCLRHPKTVGAEVAALRGIIPTHQTLARRRVVRKQRRGARRKIV